MNQPSLFIQLLSMLGALLCLIAYVCLQLRKLDANKIPYNILNALGSAILAYIAIKPFQAGFFIMEFIWFITSIVGCYHAFMPAKNHDGK